MALPIFCLLWLFNSEPDHIQISIFFRVNFKFLVELVYRNLAVQLIVELPVLDRALVILFLYDFSLDFVEILLDFLSALFYSQLLL